MAKLAAFLPLIAGVGLGAASSIIESRGRKNFMKQQEAANQRWLEYQRRKTADFEAEDAVEKKKATTAFDQNLEANSLENRENVIDAEAARLGEDFTEGLPEFAQDTLGNAQQPGQSEVFDDAMAKGLATATADARQRVQALARATAYGGGSQFGMGQTLGDVFSRASEDIGFANNNRLGNVNSLKRYQTVEPEVLDYEQSPLVPILGAASSIVSGMDPATFTGGKLGMANVKPRANPRAGTPGFSFLPIANTTTGPAQFTPTYTAPQYGPQ